MPVNAVAFRPPAPIAPNAATTVQRVILFFFFLFLGRRRTLRVDGHDLETRVYRIA